MRLGIDADSWKLTVCLSGPTVVMFEQQPIRSRGESLFDAIQGVAGALSLIVSRLGIPPEEIYIERGFGAFRKADFELGAIYGATVVAARRIVPNAHLGSVEPRQWKKAVTAACGISTKKGVPGNANAPKALANECCREILTVRGMMREALTPDHLDAFGIIYYVEDGASGNS